MRLTEKNKVAELLTFQKNNVLMTDNDYKELKLGQLEDIEDELGIEITILWKAFKNGFYFVNQCGNIESAILKKTKIEELVENIKWYGKTWALTKEELK